MDRVEIARATDGWSVLVTPWPKYENGEVWWNAKIQSPKGKGGYWIGWNGNRFSRSTQLEKLFNEKPELLGELHAIFSLWHRKESNGKAM